MNLAEFAAHLNMQLTLQPWIGTLPMYLAKDAEGNGFKPFCGDFEIQTREEIDEDVEKGQEDERVIVYWPDY